MTGPDKSAPSKSRRAAANSSSCAISRRAWPTCIAASCSATSCAGSTPPASRMEPARSWAMSTMCIRFAKATARTQMLYLSQLASQAGHRIDIERIRNLNNWIEVSQAAHRGDYAPMGIVADSPRGADHCVRRREHRLRGWRSGRLTLLLAEVEVMACPSRLASLAPQDEGWCRASANEDAMRDLPHPEVRAQRPRSLEADAHARHRK